MKKNCISYGTQLGPISSFVSRAMPGKNADIMAFPSPVIFGKKQPSHSRHVHLASANLQCRPQELSIGRLHWIFATPQYRPQELSISRLHWIFATPQCRAQERSISHVHIVTVRTKTRDLWSSFIIQTIFEIYSPT